MIQAGIQIGMLAGMLNNGEPCKDFGESILYTVNTANFETSKPALVVKK